MLAPRSLLTIWVGICAVPEGGLLRLPANCSPAKLALMLSLRGLLRVSQDCSQSRWTLCCACGATAGKPLAGVSGLEGLLRCAWEAALVPCSLLGSMGAFAQLPAC